MKRIIVRNVSKTFKTGFKKNQSALSGFVSLFSGREPKKTTTSNGVSFEAEEGGL